MATYTEHYGLHQWVPEDNFLRSDFNVDLEKIDTALDKISETADSKVSVVTGSYAGDGTEEQFIELGFVPKALYVCSKGGIAGISSGPYCYGGLAFPETPIKMSGEIAGEILDNGFKVYKHSDYFRINNTNEVYYYIAFQ